MKHAQPQKFSDQLKHWIDSKQPKTLDTLIAAFGDKSFSVIILLFMLLPALPFPTAAHFFEAIALLIVAQQIIGLKTIWVPKLISKSIHLENVFKGKVITGILKRIEWLESKSSPRWRWLFAAPLFNQIIGIIISVFIITAFVALPFSGLDTLPAMGVVLIALAMLLDDALMLLAGIIIGTTGVIVSLFFGTIVVSFIKSLF